MLPSFGISVVRQHVGSELRSFLWTRIVLWRSSVSFFFFFSSVFILKVWWADLHKVILKGSVANVVRKLDVSPACPSISGVRPCALSGPFQVVSPSRGSPLCRVRGPGDKLFFLCPAAYLLPVRLLLGGGSQSPKANQCSGSKELFFNICTLKKLTEKSQLCAKLFNCKCMLNFK